MTLSALEQATSNQQKASDPALSAWVSANAGSGKTHVLTTRVIRLMLEGTPPERILCLTFTKAAAAEMSTRIFRTLGDWVTLGDDALIEAVWALSGHARLAPEELAPARRLFARALETPGGLKVQTIHAFCEGLLQRFPLEADVPPGFEVVDERAASQMLRDATSAVLAEAARETSGLRAALDAVVGHMQAPDFDAVLNELLTARRRPDSAGAAEVGRGLRQLHGLAPGDTVESVLADALGGEADYRDLAGALMQGGKQDQGIAGGILSALAAQKEVDRFLGLGAVFLTTSGTPRTENKLMTKSTAAAHPALAEWFAGEQARFLAAHERFKAATVCAASEALLELCDAIIARHEDEKRLRSLLDYDDLITRTLDLFASSAAAWVLYKLDGGLDHILVDEAQDTSPQQWQVIQALSEEFFSGAGARSQVVRTVFAVGDEKQSIFSFQGADPEKFDEMRSHFDRRVARARAEFERVPLTVSFRSTSTVLQCVDRVFEHPDARRGLTQSGDAPVHEPKRAGEAGLVEIWPTVKPEEREEPDHWAVPLDHESADSPRARLAATIADRIDGWLRNKELLPSRNRPIEAGDILILVRRRDAFVDAVVRELKRRDIPVAGADRLVLTGHIAVKDLLALAQFVLLSDDDLTLATLLKSPLVAKADGGAFDDDDLFELAHGRPGRLWPTLQAAAAGSSDWATAYDLLGRWRARAGWQRPYEFFSDVLGPDGARLRFIERLGAEANDPIDEFLNLTLHYERQDVASLQGFVQWMTSADTDIKRDMEHGHNEVRVMTVHGAKGLEANVVFLPDTCGVPDHRNDPKIFTLEHDGAKLPVWPIAKAYETEPVADGRSAYRQRRLEEYNRLLYVAMTRACDRLYVCGYETRQGRAPGCWYDLIAKALAPHGRAVEDPAFGEPVLRIEDHGAAGGETPGAEKTTLVAPARPPGWAREMPPPEPERARFLAPSRLNVIRDEEGNAAVELEEQPVLSPLSARSDRRFLRGRLIHVLLQMLPELEPSEREMRAQAYLGTAGRDLDPEARDEIFGAVTAVLEHPEFCHLFGPESRAEVALAGRLPVSFEGAGDIAISGQLDRLVATDEEVLIVDYKTNRPAPGSPEDAAPVYVRQLAAYRLAVATLYPDRPVRAFLLWTDGPSLMELPAAMLDAALPSR